MRCAPAWWKKAIFLYVFLFQQIFHHDTLLVQASTSSLSSLFTGWSTSDDPDNEATVSKEGTADSTEQKLESDVQVVHDRVESCANPDLVSGTSSCVDSKVVTRNALKNRNRQLEASVSAGKWPTTPESPLCEAFAFFKSVPDSMTHNKNGHSSTAGIYSKWGLEFLANLSQIILQKSAKEEAQNQNRLQTYHDGFNMALQIAQKSYPNHHYPYETSFDSKMLELAISTRVHAPLCETYRLLGRSATAAIVASSTSSRIKEYYSNENDNFASNPIPAFAVLEGGTESDVAMTQNDLSSLLRKARDYSHKGHDTSHKEGNSPVWTEVLPNETPFLSSTHKYPARIILYGVFHSLEFAELFQLLLNQQEEQDTIPFLVRHVGPVHNEEYLSNSKSSGETITSSAIEETLLQGYGVRIDIRNVEYKSYDDKASTEGSDIEEELNHDEAADNLISENSIHNIAPLSSPLLGDISYSTTNIVIPPEDKQTDLSLQAASVIAASNDPLVTLQQISQNLPSHAAALVNVTVSPTFREQSQQMERLYFQSRMPSKNGVADVFINGRKFDIDRPSFNLFEFINVIREEHGFLSSMWNDLEPFLSLMVKDDNADSADIEEKFDIVSSLLSAGKNSMASSQSQSMGGLLNENDSDEIRINVGKGYRGAVIYANDIERDREFAEWPRQLQSMLMNMQYGRPPTVRRNLLTVLLVLDPLSPSLSGSSSDEDEIGLLGTIEMLLQMLQGGYPVRIGVLLVNNADINKSCDGNKKECVVSNDLSSKYYDEDFDDLDTMSKILKESVSTHAIFKLFKYVKKTYGGMVGINYLYLLLHQMQEKQNKRPSIVLQIADLVDIHSQILMRMRIPSHNAKAEVIRILIAPDTTAEHDETYNKAVQFAASKKLQTNMAFVNGLHLPLSNEAQSIIQKELQHIFKLIMSQQITDSAPRSVYAMLLKADNVYNSMHPLLTESVAKYELIQNGNSTSSMIEVKKSQKKSRMLFEALVDLTTESGIKMIMCFISAVSEFAKNEKSAEVSIAYQILPIEKGRCNTLDLVFQHATRFEEAELLSLLEKELARQDGQSDVVDSIIIPKTVQQTIDDLIELQDCKNSSHSQQYDGENVILANGRRFVPQRSITTEDIEILYTLEKDQAEKIAEKLISHESTDLKSYLILARVAAVLGKMYSSSEDESIERVDNASVFEEFDYTSKNFSNKNQLFFSWRKGRSEQPKIVAIIDPLSQAVQRISPILYMLREQLQLSVTLILLPRSKIVDGNLPITSYYRFATGSGSSASKKINQSKAIFGGLPRNHLLTMQMDVPEPWDVQQSYAIQDTDNLRCDRQSCGDEAYASALKKNTGEYDSLGSINGGKFEDLTEVRYNLNHLLFFGQCYDVSVGSPPNGLQLKLSDTIFSTRSKIEASSNGSFTNYFSENERQLSSDTLVMKTVGYWQLRANPGVWKLNIAEGSRGASIFEMETDQASPNTGTTSKTVVMTDFLNRGEALLMKRKAGFENAELLVEETDRGSKNEETINVFSLATGHLYERFLKIMMLSVTKRTSTRVKFWLFENYLSPSFKSSAYAMAQRIGCDIEFVTYKWPEWLRGQSEKQRIIWGYKILFLDVLFPLDLKKIIYVDADQVVRGDLKELWDLDLNGAPYGYTPFCQSREETLGYQFWREGFWPNHLKGKPYHISALYVVDLERFRRELVGDKLRGLYQQLSADPNNLSNLDQDLPNFAQNEVKIHSLPQDWLWCESWCSDETKATAKTIDLCNNPEHKEPKVIMAKRIISGDLFEESWIELDAEVDGYEKDYQLSISK